MIKKLLETTDGGKTFVVVADLSDRIVGYPQGLTFQGEKGYIAVSYHGVDSYLYTTVDGGITWEDEKIAPAERIKADEMISYTRERIHLPLSVLHCGSAHSLYNFNWQMFLVVSIYRRVPARFQQPG